MKKPLIALGILFFILYSPLSCFHIDVEQTNSAVIIDSLSLATIKLRDGLNGLEILDHVRDEDTVDTGNFGLAMKIYDFHFEDPSHAPNLFIPVALAGAQPYSPLKIALISITCTDTVFANGEVFEPGSSLTNLFTAQDLSTERQTVLKYLQELDRWYVGTRIFLRISATPDQPVTQPFRVKVTMADDTVFELESKRIYITSRKPE